MAWHSSWDFDSDTQYRNTLNYRLEDLRLAINERIRLIYSVGGYGQIVIPEFSNSYRNAYEIIVLLKNALLTLISSYSSANWIDEVVTGGDFLGYMTANKIITRSGGASPHDLIIFTNSTVNPTIGNTTTELFLTSLNLPTNYLEETPYRGLYEQNEIPIPDFVEDGYNIWDYNEVGCKKIVSKLLRLIYTANDFRSWNGNSETSVEFIGGEENYYYHSSWNGATGHVSDHYPSAYGNYVATLPTVQYKGFITAFPNYTAGAYRSGNTSLFNTWRKYPDSENINFNSTVLWYEMGESAIDYWRSTLCNGPGQPYSCSFNDTKGQYVDPDTNYDKDEYTLIIDTDEDLIINTSGITIDGIPYDFPGTTITYSTPEFGKYSSGDTPLACDVPISAAPNNGGSIKAGGAHRSAGWSGNLLLSINSEYI